MRTVYTRVDVVRIFAGKTPTLSLTIQFSDCEVLWHSLLLHCSNSSQILPRLRVYTTPIKDCFQRAKMPRRTTRLLHNLWTSRKKTQWVPFPHSLLRCAHRLLESGRPNTRATLRTIEECSLRLSLPMSKVSLRDSSSATATYAHTINNVSAPELILLYKGQKTRCS